MNQIYSRYAQSRILLALSQSKDASELRHPGLKGRVREVFVKELLTPFLSPNLGICTGNVVDSHGGISGQIDIIIYDKTLIPSLLLIGEVGVIPIESVLATIEVKSTLTRGELKKAIKNARSIKTLRAEFPEVKPESLIKSSPVCCLYAFDSDSKPESELNRLRKAVADANRDAQPAVHVPLSGICVGDSVSFHCSHIDPNDPSVNSFEQSSDRAATRFMVFLIDAASMLERQRSKMLISHYFLDRHSAETGKEVRS
jgi:hypothetical protein